ncbi:hypothetical protein T09_11928 [Trichinella sp. T9]|nr:hypothetical protein T09_11928 [Trichinella sp. T9]
MGNITRCSIWPACCQHPALVPSRYVAALSLNDRFHLYLPRAYYLLMSVSNLYVQFYGAFIVQCPRPHLRQHRQQKMKKPDLTKSPVNEDQERKADIVLFYNETKSGVDTLDQPVLVYTCKRRTRRWPMVLWFTTLDCAVDIVLQKWAASPPQSLPCTVWKAIEQIGTATSAEWSEASKDEKHI